MALVADSATTAAAPHHLETSTSRQTLPDQTQAGAPLTSRPTLIILNICQNFNIIEIPKELKIVGILLDLTVKTPTFLEKRRPEIVPR